MNRSFRHRSYKNIIHTFALIDKAKFSIKEEEKNLLPAILIKYDFIFFVIKYFRSLSNI